MKWYKTFGYQDHKYYWWTQRDQRGICFEIRQNGEKFYLYMCENFVSKHEGIQAAMDAAAKL